MADRARDVPPGAAQEPSKEPSQEPSEEELVARARRGDAQAFSSIVSLYQRRVRVFIGGFVARASDVDDLAQEVFLTAFRRLPEFRGDSTYSTWLFGLARIQVLRHLRQEGVRQRRGQGALEEQLAAWTVDQLGASERDDARFEERATALLRWCLERLGPSSARLVHDHYFGGATLAELARRSGRKEGTVRMVLLRIRQALRACVQRGLREGG